MRHDGQLSPDSKPLSKSYDCHDEANAKKWMDEIIQEIIDHYGTFKDTLKNGKLFVVVPKDVGDKETHHSIFSRECIESMVKRVTVATETLAIVLQYDITENSEVPDYAALEVHMDARKDYMLHPDVFFNGAKCWK
jgi:hypothetical protein